MSVLDLWILLFLMLLADLLWSHSGLLQTPNSRSCSTVTSEEIRQRHQKKTVTTRIIFMNAYFADGYNAS